MRDLIILLIFFAIIIVGAIWQLITIYKKVFADLKTREFKNPENRHLWRKIIIFLPPFGGLIYHTIFIYEPPRGG